MPIASLKKNDPVSDVFFDQIFPESLQGDISEDHWTPVEIAKTASSWLSEFAYEICDLGCGSGKFCLVGAAITYSNYTGVDYRKSLIDVANGIVSDHYLNQNISFIHQDFCKMDLTPFNGFYFYNPYLEHLFKTPLLTQEIKTDLSKIRTYTSHLKNYFASVNKPISIVTYDNVFSIIPNIGFELKRTQKKLALYQNF